MTLEPNDPRLTALLLGELTDAERAALEAKVAASEPLFENADAVRQTVESLRAELAAEPCPHLSPVQRELVLQQIAAAGGSSGTASAGTWVPLLGSIGWGAWGAWMAAGAASLLVLAGLITWQFGWNRPDDEPTEPASAGVEQPQDGASVAAVDGPVSTGGQVTGDLSVITICVGQSLRLNVLGRLEGGREISLAPDRLSWSTQPLGDYVDFDPRTMTLKGVQTTPEPVVLTVYLDGMEAQVRVNVTPRDSKKEERQDG